MTNTTAYEIAAAMIDPAPAAEQYASNSAATRATGSRTKTR